MRNNVTIWMVTLVIGDRCRKRGRLPAAKERNAAAKPRRLEEAAIIITEVAAGAPSGMPPQQTEGRRCWRIGTLSTINWTRSDIPKIRQDAQELLWECVSVPRIWSQHVANKCRSGFRSFQNLMCRTKICRYFFVKSSVVDPEPVNPWIICIQRVLKI